MTRSDCVTAGVSCSGTWRFEENSYTNAKSEIIVADLSKEDPTLKRKPGDDALSASEARYRRLLETAQDGILILDAHSGLIIDVNPFLVHLLDYSREDFIGKTLWDIGSFKQIQESKAAFRQLLDQ